MNDGGDCSGGGGGRAQWWWALASSGQLGLGLWSFRRGGGNPDLVPLQAFGVASLFVGAAASAFISGLQAAGIRKGQDLLDIGQNIRSGLGLPPRTRGHAKKDDVSKDVSEVYRQRADGLEVLE